jgi:hypothetical protein
MSKQKYHSKKVSQKTTAKATKQVIDQPFNWLIFSLKLIVIFIAVAAVVAYTDSKEYFVGDQTNNHVHRKWRSFYRFADKEHKNVDIVIFGNSHASAGIEPYVLSIGTNSNAFILNTPGSSAIDAYFNLKEVLNHGCKPQIAIIETFCLTGGEIGLEWGRIQSLEAKQGVWNKLKMTPFMFESDEWVKAWSPTIRNHNFLLTDTSRIAFNAKNIGKEKNPDRKKLDLGRFSHGDNYIKDTTLALYETKGRPVKDGKWEISKGNAKYLKKIYKLCKDNDIQLMYFTTPMYYKTFENYPNRKKQITEAFDKITPNTKWLDLQQDYDTAAFSTQAFNDEYGGAQHTTSYGMNIFTQKLISFIYETYGNILPDRSNEEKWIKDFYDQPYFLYYQPMPATMQNAYQVAKDETINNFEVTEMPVMQEKDYNQIIMKINKTQQLPHTLNCVLQGELAGQKLQFQIQLSKLQHVNPVGFEVYAANIHKDLKVEKIISIQH